MTFVIAPMHTVGTGTGGYAVAGEVPSTAQPRLAKRGDAAH